MGLLSYDYRWRPRSIAGKLSLSRYWYNPRSMRYLWSMLDIEVILPPLIAASVLVACAGSDRPTKETHSTEGTADSMTQVDTASISTADTGTTTPIPDCTQPAMTTKVRLTGDEAGDWAGHRLDVADIDGDGCAEVLVSEPWGSGQYGAGGIHSGVHLLQEPWVTDTTLWDAAYASYEGSGDNIGADDWGYWAAFLPDAGQITISNTDPFGARVTFFELPSGSQAVPIPATDVVGNLTDPEVSFPTDLGPCVGEGGTAVCVGAADRERFDFAGQVFLFDAPVQTQVPVAAARSIIYGDPGDTARRFVGDADLTGDGIDDLAIGAYYVGNVGSVGLIEGPVPDGESRLWDIASSTFTGVEPGWNFGLFVQMGDLNGDGEGSAGGRALRGPRLRLRVPRSSLRRYVGV